MFKELREKVDSVIRSSSHKWDNDNWSFYRLWVFVFSWKGQRRIWKFIVKTFLFVFRKTFGIKLIKKEHYDLWMREHFPGKLKQIQYKIESEVFRYRPLISIILPVYNTPVNFLNEAIESVLGQVYDKWELCISDDNSSDPEIRAVIDGYCKKDPRIKAVYLSENSHIVANSNSALSLASGEYIALLDHDDKLSPDALYQNVKLLNQHPEADLIYSDEDKFAANGKHSHPHFKPDWCPDNFLSRNYIGHLVLIRASLVSEVGNFRPGYEGSQDYDLLLRITEKTKNIFHIPLVLYHWREHDASTSFNREAKPYAFNAGIRALEDALRRRNIEGSVSLIENTTGYYSIRYKIFDPGKVSVIIPTKNKPELCETVISSIFNLTDYHDFEVILVDNNSDEPEFADFVERWKQKEPVRFRCIEDHGEFNFSRLMNNAASHANGKYLLLLNNDTEVTHADWMTALVEQCQFKSTGAAGVKLLYHNNSIQHAGVIIGLGGVAGHTFVGFDRNAAGYYNYLKCTSNYSAMTAACLMMRKEVFDEVGGFEQQLAIDYNDIDFCLKLKDKGYNNLYVPHVTLYHYESFSRGHSHKTKKSYQQHISEGNLFKQKWKKYIDHDPCYSPHLSMLYTDFRMRIGDKLQW